MLMLMNLQKEGKMNKDQEIKNLKKQLAWFKDFADCVQGDHRTYDIACEYADELEVEREGEDYSGSYSSVHDFINKFDLEDEANEKFGEGWEAENDIEQIQELVGDDFIVKALEPTNKREERIDDYIIISKEGGQDE